MDSELVPVIGMESSEESEAADDADDANEPLLPAPELADDGCWWSCCVFPYTNVATSRTRAKMRHAGLIRFPRASLRHLAAELTTLDLRHNAIEALPAWLRDFQALRELSVADNALRTLHPALYSLSRLEVLDVSNNRVAFFERSLLGMVQLRVLRAQGNPVGWPPRAVLAAGSMDAVRVWARRSRAPPTYRCAGARGAYVDVSWQARYYLGPDPNKDEDRHHVEAESVVAELDAPWALHHPDVLVAPRVLYWGVYDGHSGDAVAIALETYMYQRLSGGGCFDANASDAELRERVRAVYLAMDAKVTEQLRGLSRKRRKPGSCCTAVWLLGTRLVVSHVGDSRVVMVGADGSALELAPDHHPDAPRERERIEARGGDIVFRGCWRVHSPQEGMYLAVSRAFGDVSLKDPKVIIDADPDVTIRQLTANDKWLIVASDGLWCRVENDAAAAALSGCTSAVEAADRLIFEAKSGRTHDNTTVIAVRLEHGSRAHQDGE